MNTPDLPTAIGFSPAEISQSINAAILQQHAEDAAFLWLLRDAAVNAPHYYLKDLAELDERVAANIDGLRIAGDAGWQVCQVQLEYREPGEIFTASTLAFESGDAHRIQTVLDFGAADSSLSRAVISSLAWMPFSTSASLMARLIEGNDAGHRRIGIAAFAAQGKDPGAVLKKLCHDNDAGVRARAFKAAGQLGRKDLFNDIINGVYDSDAACQFNAAWSALRLGSRDESIIAILGDAIILVSSQADEALNMVLRCLSMDQARILYKKLLSSPKHIPLAVKAAGIIGDGQLIPELIQWMHQPDLARLAGEAFSMMTGVDIEYEDLDQDAPENSANVAGEDDPEDVMAANSDEDLPWPNPVLVARWWQEHQKQYKPGIPYFRGAAIDNDILQVGLREGNQRQRHAAALILALKNPQQPVFPVRAPYRHQMRLLQK